MRWGSRATDGLQGRGPMAGSQPGGWARVPVAMSRPTAYVVGKGPGHHVSAGNARKTAASGRM